MDFKPLLSWLIHVEDIQGIRSDEFVDRDMAGGQIIDRIHCCAVLQGGALRCEAMRCVDRRLLVHKLD